MATYKTDLDHALQLRLPKATVAEIDDAIATIHYLDGFNRSSFIRHAILYALDSIAEVKGQEQGVIWDYCDS
jgi:Arc/MetJ-type ribon-helix-helix transcriptional regulator